MSKSIEELHEIIFEEISKYTKYPPREPGDVDIYQFIERHKISPEKAVRAMKEIGRKSDRVKCLVVFDYEKHTKITVLRVIEEDPKNFEENSPDDSVNPP